MSKINIDEYLELYGENIRKNLKYYREKKGFSKLKLSKEAGVHRRTIEHIENGKIKTSKIETLIALSKPLEITLQDLLKKEE